MSPVRPVRVPAVTDAGNIRQCETQVCLRDLRLGTRIGFMPSGFPPIADSVAEVLILGSLPGRRSLELQQYYAQPRNAFWHIMGELFDAGPDWSYAERLRRLKAAGVALWDVLAAAERAGSLDSAIVGSSVVANPFGAFFGAHGNIRRIYFNGGKAAELYRRYALPDLDATAAALPSVQLPSTSPAHATRSFADKLAAWTVIRSAINEAP